MQVIWECMYINDRHHAPMPRGCHLVAVEKPTGHTALARIFLCKYNKQCIPEIGSLTSVTSMYITRRQLFVVDQTPKVCEILKDPLPPASSTVEFHWWACCILQIVKIILLLPMLTGQKTAFEYSLNNTYNFWMC